MKTQIVDLQMKKKSDVEVSDSIFGVELNKDIVSRVVNWQRSKSQSGLHYTKGRSDVVGTGKKPFRQKGTGNARQGSKYVSQMRGGGIVFGPKVRSHAHKLPKKIRSSAIKMVLSNKFEEKKIHIVDSLDFADHKTKNAAKVFPKNNGSVLIISENDFNQNFERAISNLFWVNHLPLQGLNVYDLLLHDKLLITQSALKKLEERLI